MSKLYDYIICGAGSAGCVLASKLSADPDVRVLILEAGPMDRNLMIHIPAGVYAVYTNPKLNWNYETEDEPELNGRNIFTPRGKVVGGSSSINSMVYMRGTPGTTTAGPTNSGLISGATIAACPTSRQARPVTGARTSGAATAARWASPRARSKTRCSTPSSTRVKRPDRDVRRISMATSQRAWRGWTAQRRTDAAAALPLPICWDKNINFQ